MITIHPSLIRFKEATADEIRSATHLYFEPLLWVARVLRQAWNKARAPSAKSTPHQKLRGMGLFSFDWMNTSYMSHSRIKATEAIQLGILKYFEESSQSDKSAMSALYSELALTYFKEGDLKKSEESLLKALEINRSIHNISEVAINLANIGWVYHMHGIRTKAGEYYSKAEEYYFKALEDKTTGQGEISTIHFNLGLIYQKYHHDLERARGYFKQALKEDYEWHRWKYLIQDCVSLLLTV